MGNWSKLVTVTYIELCKLITVTFESQHAAAETLHCIYGSFGSAGWTSTSPWFWNKLVNITNCDETCTTKAATINWNEIHFCYAPRCNVNPAAFALLHWIFCFQFYEVTPVLQGALMFRTQLKRPGHETSNLSGSLGKANAFPMIDMIWEAKAALETTLDRRQKKIRVH